MLAHATVLEGGGREVRELAEDLDVGVVELAVVADDRRTEDARDPAPGPDRHRRTRSRDLVLDHGRADDLAVVAEQHRLARHEHLAHGAFIPAGGGADQVPRDAVPGGGYGKARVARAANEEARPVDARHPPRVAAEPLEP